MSAHPGEMPWTPVALHSPKCSRRTVVATSRTRALSRRQKLTLLRAASVLETSGRRREYAAIASKCQWSWPK